MFDLFQYDFMLKALLVAMAISLASASIGQVVVLRRLSQLGDALSHTSLAGVALGLILGLNPVLGAFLFTLLAAFAIELLRKFFPRYAEISIAIIFSFGIGLAGILSGFTKTGNFSSFLFGSIIAVSPLELALVSGISLVVFFLINFFSHAYCYLTFDETAAKLSGLNIASLNTLLTILTAVTISVASRAVGALVVSSLLVLPVASAMQVSRSFKQLRLFSHLFSLCYAFAGLWLSFLLNLKPGGTIVLLSVLGLLLCFAIKQIRTLVESK